MSRSDVHLNGTNERPALARYAAHQTPHDPRRRSVDGTAHLGWHVADMASLDTRTGTPWVVLPLLTEAEARAQAAAWNAAASKEG